MYVIKRLLVARAANPLLEGNAIPVDVYILALSLAALHRIILKLGLLIIIVSF